ncbi:hypothetical protein AB395_00006448 (plasmid) [Sinorhizobium fredii CCBAU 45436]|nr:hypothetical protein AB395_00006448 [Sinorhizobium fredii CCBAU 45436]
MDEFDAASDTLECCVDIFVLEIENEVPPAIRAVFQPRLSEDRSMERGTVVKGKPVAEPNEVAMIFQDPKLQHFAVEPFRAVDIGHERQRVHELHGKTIRADLL